MTRRFRCLSSLVVMLGLALLPGPARAQEPAPVEGGEAAGTGEPLYGYVGTAFLAAGIMFVLCKSARR